MSYDIYGIVDHRDRSGHLYFMNETAGPRTLIMLSHTLCTIWSLLVKFLAGSEESMFSWTMPAQRINQYMIAATLEIVQQGIMDYLCISFMIAGHIKFSPNQLFSITARDFYSSDVLTRLSWLLLWKSMLVFYKGSVVQAWRKTVANKYSNLPGIRELYDFLALRNHGHYAAIKVRDNC